MTDIKEGDFVRVLPHDVYFHLRNGALSDTPRVKKHNGHKKAQVKDIFTHGEVCVLLDDGQFDYVSIEHCQLIGDNNE